MKRHFILGNCWKESWAKQIPQLWNKEVKGKSSIVVVRKPFGQEASNNSYGKV